MNLMAFKQLFLLQWRAQTRNGNGLFFVLLMPLAIYIAASLVPLQRLFDFSVSYPAYLLPGVLALTLMQGGIYGLAYFMIDFRTSGINRRFLVTPLSQMDYFLSLIAARLVVQITAAVVLALVAALLFQVHLPSLWPLALLICALGSLIFLGVGLLISTSVDSYEASAPITSLVALPMTFLGNIFFPVANLPHFLQVISTWLPITYFSSALRIIFAEQASVANLTTPVLGLIVWLVIILLLLVWRFRLK